MSALILTVKGALALVFLLAGGAELAGAKPLAEQFREFGLPMGAIRVVGFLEVAGAIGLWIEPFPIWAALGLAGLTVGAVAKHVKVHHPFSKSAPSLIFGVMSVVLAALIFYKA